MRQNVLGITGAALVAAGLALGIGTGIVADDMRSDRGQTPIAIEGRGGPEHGPFIGFPNRPGPAGDRHQPDRRR